MAVKAKRNYVNKEELYQEIIKSKERGELTPFALKMLMQMVAECSKKFRYKYAHDKDDCMSTAYLDILLYWKSFDPEKSNQAFSYFTSMIFRGFCKGFNKQHPLKENQLLSINEQDGIHNF
jgi:hypothetical protein